MWSLLAADDRGLLAELADDADVDYLLDRFTRSRRRQTGEEFAMFISCDLDYEWRLAGRPSGAPFVELVDQLLPPKRRPTPPTPKEPA